jgi:hypothetical protein
MRLHRMMIARSMIALPAAMLVLTSLMVLVRGGEPPRVDYRDREVLEAALKDMLDPKNPLYRNEKGEPYYYGPWPRTIVLHRLTGVDDWDGDELEYHIPHAAMSETSSNSWKLSVISVFSRSAWVVGRPSRVSLIAA